MFRPLLHGFRNRDLRGLASQLLGHRPNRFSPGQTSYDLRRLHHHGLIDRIPGTHRYRVSDTGLTQALFGTRVHDRACAPASPSSPTPRPAHCAAPPAPTRSPSTD